MRIVGWVDRPAISEKDVLQRWNDVGERLHERKATQLFKSIVAELMQGKSMEFNAAVFIPYARAAGEQYLKTPEEKRKLLNEAIWEVEEHLETDPLRAGLPVGAQEILFSVDGEEWSVARFQDQMQRHPLVFRKRTMNQGEFPEQLKLAIADMIRDETVTQAAYERGYDKTTAVVEHTAIFRDHYLSRQYRDDYLNAVIPRDQRATISEAGVLDRYLNPLVDSLQAAYNDRIRINTDLFETLETTRIPMMVSQRGVPYPLMVPAFPRLTTDSRLDYGSRMEIVQ
jgi:hypothetical protein